MTFAAAGRRCSRSGRSACSGGRHEPRRRRPGAGDDDRRGGDGEATPSLSPTGWIALAVVDRRGAARAAGVRGVLRLPDPHEGAVARPGRREPDLPVGLRRHGVARPGGDLRHGRDDLREPGRGRRRQPGSVVAVDGRDRRDRRRDGRRPPVRLDRVAQRGDLLPDADARVLGARLLLLLAGHAAVGLRRRQQPRPPEPGRRSRGRSGPAVLHRARRLRRPVRVDALRLAHAVRPRAAGPARRAGAHARARLQRAGCTARSRSRSPPSSRPSPGSWPSGTTAASRRGRSTSGRRSTCW